MNHQLFNIVLHDTTILFRVCPEVVGMWFYLRTVCFIYELNKG